MATVTGTSGNDRIGVGFSLPDGVDPRTGATDGADSIRGLAGADQILAGNGEDTISGGSGNDTLNGGAGNDRVGGGIDNDRLDGGFGIDTLNGGAGDDDLFGSLDGSRDILTGGPGADTFRNPFEEDFIVDFDAAEGDILIA